MMQSKKRLTFTFRKWLALICIFQLAASLLYGCSAKDVQNAAVTDVSEQAAEENVPNQTVQTAASELSLSEAALTDSWDDSAATHITCNGSSIDVTGDGAAADEGSVTITAGGTYVITGSLSNGQLIIDAREDDIIQLVLNSIDITCQNSAAIYGVNAGEIILTLAENSENSVTDGTTYTYEADEDEPDAAIFSHDDLAINGSGELTVNGNYLKGIRSKDELSIINGTLNVTAADDAISGKDGLVIAGGTFVIKAGEDALKSSNDSDADKGDLHITGGVFSINAGDDAIHAEKNLIIDGGSIRIESSTEALEGMTVTVNGGDINLVSSDDGINAAGTGLADDIEAAENTTDSSQEQAATPQEQAAAPQNQAAAPQAMANDRRGGMEAATDYNYIRITGGNITIDAGGDGIDSNGNLYVDGGTVSVYGPTNDGNSALDYAGAFEITGGTFIAAGSSGMAQTAGEQSTQASLMIYFNSEQQPNTTIELADENNNTIAGITSPKVFRCVLFSTPAMTVGSTYTVKSGGNELCSITLDSISVSVSEDGTAVQGGGMMGLGGARPGNPSDSNAAGNENAPASNGTDENMPEPPTDGNMPEPPADGMMPEGGPGGGPGNGQGAPGGGQGFSGSHK